MSENIERYLDLTGLTQYDSNIKTVIQKDITSAWDGSSHSYVVGDYVVYKGVLYQCKTAHTSSSTFDATKWNQVKLIDNVLYDYISKNIADAYDTTKTYPTAGEYVSYNGQLYKIKSGQTATGAWDSLKWTAIQVMEQVQNDITSKINTSVTSNIADGYNSSSAYSVGDFVTRNGQLYKCNTAIPTGGEAWNSSHWTAVQIMEEVEAAFPAQDPNTVFAGPSTGDTADTPTFRALNAKDFGRVNPHQVLIGPVGTAGGQQSDAPEKPSFRILAPYDIPDLGGTYQKIITGHAGTTVGSSTSIPTLTFDANNQITSIGTASVVSANDGTLTIKNAASNPSSSYTFTANQSGDTDAVIDKTFVGLGSVVNTGDSDTPTSGGTTKFTTGGAYTLKADLEEQIRTQSAHFRGNFDNWAGVPKSDSSTATPHYIRYDTDPTGKATPTLNDYIVINDTHDAPAWAASTAYVVGDYVIYSNKLYRCKTAHTSTSTFDSTKWDESDLTGTWRFTYTGTWSTANIGGWEPAYKIENPVQTFKTINNQSILGTGNITTPDHYQAPTYTSSTNALQLGTGNGGSSNMYVPYANGTTQAGVVSTVAQTFGGVKTFSSAPKFDSGASYKQGSNTIYATVVGNGSASAATTITLPSSTGTLVIEDDLPVVEFSENPYTTGTVTTIKGMKVGNDQYNFYVPDSIAAATTEVLGSVKLGTASAGTATKTYPVGFNASQQMYVDVPWTDTATAATGQILDGTNTGTQVKYAPYSSTTANATWVANNSHAGKLYLGTVNPQKDTRLNYNGNLYATKLYTATAPGASTPDYTPSEVVNLASAQSITGVKTFSNIPKFDMGIKVFQINNTYATITGDTTATGNIDLKLPKTSGTLALDGDIGVKSVTDGIWDLDISSAKVLTVSPYGSSSAGHFDNSNTAPTSTTTRLNWNGILYVPQLNIATNGGLLFYDGTSGGYKNAIITGAQTRLQYKQTTGTAKDIAFTSDIPYVSMAYDTHANTAAAGQPSTAYNETTWNYRQEGTSGDPLTVKFQSIKESEIAALF